MSADRTVPARSGEVAVEVRKSRFIARVARVDSRAAALEVVAVARQDHPQARHHCWAYLIGDPKSAATAASSDDGEPSGTAGRPILNVIQHKGLGDTVVVVIRYFGGVKLGAGGLVRAYAQATEAVLTAVPTERHEERLRVEVAGDFAREQAIRHWAGLHGATIEAVDYGEGVRLSLSVPVSAGDALRAFCGAEGIAWEAVGRG